MSGPTDVSVHHRATLISRQAHFLEAASQHTHLNAPLPLPPMLPPPEASPEDDGGQPGPAPPPPAESPRLAWPPVPSTVRTLLAGRSPPGAGVLAGACQFGTAWAGFRNQNPSSPFDHMPQRFK